MRRLRSALATALSLAAAAAAAEPFTPRNVLVVHDDTLFEYTQTGELVQRIDVVHPRTPAPGATDVVVDRFGRAHVQNLPTSPRPDPTISTFDPYSGAWSHVRIVGGLGVTTDGDLSLLGDTVLSKRTAFRFLEDRVIRFHVPGRTVGEVSAGLDGRLYALEAGTPRAEVRILDPESFDLVGRLTLRDGTGQRLMATGIAAAEDGTLYVADFDGHIYSFDRLGTFLGDHPTPGLGLHDVDLAPDGTLVAGTRSGEVVVTDTGFAEMRSFPVPGSTRYSYVALVPEALERPDADGDGLLDFLDGCPFVPDPEQADADGDALGDPCDPFPLDPENLSICLDEVADRQAQASLLAGDNAGLGARVALLEGDNAALRAELDALATRIDADADGVPDVADACPETRRRAPVDSNGCSPSQRRGRRRME
jgi:hypothetical protein